MQPGSAMGTEIEETEVLEARTFNATDAPSPRVLRSFPNSKPISGIISWYVFAYLLAIYREEVRICNFYNLPSKVLNKVPTL